jgi:hypothetical protein
MEERFLPLRYIKFPSEAEQSPEKEIPEKKIK